jgi:tRNA A-37 threonylcarbamoyl transferase component Bud32
MDGGELGHFSLLEKIGEGGMGQVYKARDKRLDRFVAIKLLAEARSSDADRRARFVQEAKAASALNHPNIITIHEIGEQDGQTFIVMELVDGKPLNELIPRKGMRLTEALRIAAQVADALTAAHAAGIVHRDLKPANIMVDAHGRAKVLDFGLAKLSAPAAVGADEATRTLTADQPVSEEGVILGPVPYMSPEHVEGKPVDARSDIFSFGAVLYEMITGQRAFRGESKISTLAAIVEKDPPSASEISSSTPPEVERLIARCLRKDVNRRSQNMADVKLALEELRDESASGKLARTAAVGDAGSRRWVWPTVAVACVLIAAAAFIWVYFNIRGTQSKSPELVRVSPDDGHSYGHPAISPDGGFVAYVSDRSGKNELWLQQVGGGGPIQLTHDNENETVEAPAFFPDGKRILYQKTSADRKSIIAVISTLGGEPTLLTEGWQSTLSPDGRQIAYVDFKQGALHLMTISSSGGQPRELPAWARVSSSAVDSPVWTPDSRYLLCLIVKPSEAAKAKESEWFAFPVDGGNPVATGAGAALRAAGVARGTPMLMTGDRVLFVAEMAGRYNLWEIRLSPRSWGVQGVPAQLTFGTLNEMPYSISATGTVALDVGSIRNDLYLIPLAAASGQPTGVARRLTQDERYKQIQEVGWLQGGDPGSAYFDVFAGTTESVYGVDLVSSRQTPMIAGLPESSGSVISGDGRRVAYSVAEGDSYSIRLGEAGAGPSETRALCRECGAVEGFSPDGRFLFYCPECKAKNDPKRKRTVRLLDVASGRDRPWLEHPTDSVVVAGTFDNGSRWLWVWLGPPGSWQSSWREYMVPWREEPVAQPDWIRTPWSGLIVPRSASPTRNFVYFFEGSKLMAVRFDPQKAFFSDPQEVKFVPGSAMTPKPDDPFAVRGPGLVFSRQETGNSSVWLMKLPR